MNEISETEPLSLKIGNNSESYDLSSLVSLNKELDLTNPNSQMQIIKNGTTIAKSKFNYSNGTQWITFNYEGKKQSNNSLALSLIDCIKLKVKCTSSKPNNKKIIQPQFSYKKTSIRNQMLGLKSTLPKPPSIKQSHNHSYEEDINFTNYFKDIGAGELTTTNKRNSKVLTSSVILNNRNLHTPVNKTRNFHFTSINTQKNNNNNFNTCTTARRANQASSNEKRDKTPTIVAKPNKIVTAPKNQSRKLKQFNTSTEHSHTKTQSMKSNDSEQKPSKEIVKKLDANFIKEKKKDGDTSSSPKKKISTEAEKTVQRESQNSNTVASPTLENDNNTESNSLLRTSISLELIKLNLPNESNNLLDDNNNGYNFDSMDTFSQLKNDFNLLYTEEYIKMIPDDLLRLELELLIEKMFEIVNCYHSQMSNEKIVYSKVSELYKECSHKYLLLSKKYSQLQHQKEKFQISKQNLNFINGNYIKNIQNLLTINKEEINMFSRLVKPKKNESSMLKEVLGVVLMNNRKFIRENLGEKEVKYLEQHAIQKQKKKLNKSIDVPPIKGMSNLNESTTYTITSEGLGSRSQREKERKAKKTTMLKKSKKNNII